MKPVSLTQKLQRATADSNTCDLHSTTQTCQFPARPLGHTPDNGFGWCVRPGLQAQASLRCKPTAYQVIMVSVPTPMTQAFLSSLSSSPFKTASNSGLRRPCILTMERLSDRVDSKTLEISSLPTAWFHRQRRSCHRPPSR